MTSLTLKSAAIIASDTLTDSERGSVKTLAGEILQRTEIQLPILSERREVSGPAIFVGRCADLAEKFPDLSDLLSTPVAEGFATIAKTDGTIVLAGNDEKGVLYAVDHFLRALHLCFQRIDLPLPYSALAISNWARGSSPFREKRRRPVACNSTGTASKLWAATVCATPSEDYSISTPRKNSGGSARGAWHRKRR